jgi:hypothetical protein
VYCDILCCQRVCEVFAEWEGRVWSMALNARYVHFLRRASTMLHALKSSQGAEAGLHFLPLAVGAHPHDIDTKRARASVLVGTMRTRTLRMPH